MKVIYVAGPYTGKNHFETKQNILNAEKVAIECWRKGWAVICPHKNTSGFEVVEDKKINYNTWINGDLEILSRCDAIVMVDGWKGSKGAMKELEKAKEFGLSIYFSAFDVTVLHFDQLKKVDLPKLEKTDFIF
jgi:hypothetical protein